MGRRVTERADVLVFSRDRPMQLHALLESTGRYASHLYRTVTVLYRATTPLMRLGYLDCLSAHVSLVDQAIEEGDFREDVLEWLRGQEARRPFGFLVDDDVWFRPAPEPIDAPIVSYRLGLNTDRCYPADARQAIPRTGELRSWLNWDWRDGTYDFAYPLSLDGHLFARRAMLEPIVESLSFRDPTTLEAGMAGRALELAASRMIAPKMSCLVSIPANRVSESGGGRNAGRGDWAPEALNRMYLDGWRIDLETMDFSDVRGAHQEIPLAFRPA